MNIFFSVACAMSRVWFYNMMIPTWWTDLWINEGLATYFASLAMYKVHLYNMFRYFAMTKRMFIISSLHGFKILWKETRTIVLTGLAVGKSRVYDEDK